MQKQILLCGLSLISASLFAQDKSNDTKKNDKVIVAKQATLLSVESVLVDGSLYLTKTNTVQGSGGSNGVYQIRNRSNSGFNGGKPFEIKLTKDAFDSYFLKTTPELAEKWPQLVKYAQEKKLSFNEEQTWIAVLNYYNSLK